MAYLAHFTIMFGKPINVSKCENVSYTMAVKKKKLNTINYCRYAFRYLRLCWRMRNDTPCRMKDRRFRREVGKIKAGLGV